MATTTDTAKTTALSADTTINCCNGRVGKQLAELAAQNEAFAAIIKPTGAEILRAAASAGAAAKDTINCCNGRVGRQLNPQEVLNQLSD